MDNNTVIKNLKDCLVGLKQVVSPEIASSIDKSIYWVDSALNGTDSWQVVLCEADITGLIGWVYSELLFDAVAADADDVDEAARAAWDKLRRAFADFILAY